MTFHIAAGTRLALTGASGSGKTSVLRVMAGLDEPRSGVLTCSARTALCLQDSPLLASRNVLDNVLFALGRSPTADDRKRAVKLLDGLGLAGLEHRRIGQLSGGQCRRVAIARTLIAVPDIAMIDEPFTQLDERSAGLVISTLRRHVVEGGTVVIAVHSPNEARGLTSETVPIVPA